MRPEPPARAARGVARRPGGLPMEPTKGTQAAQAQEAAMGPAPTPFQQLFPLVGGYRVSQAIYVAAVLGLADRLAGGPGTSDELAQVTGANEAALFRLLRFLSGVGLLEEVGPRRFALTA